MVRQQRQQISELRFDKIPNTQSFLVWKSRCKSSYYLFWLSVGCYVVWMKEVEMVDSLDELKSSRSVCGEDFPNFEMVDAKFASALNKIIQISSSKRRSVSRSRKPRKRIGFYEEDKSPSWSTTTFELLVLMIQYWTMRLFSVTRHDDNIQEFDKRWDKSSIVYVEDSIRWYLGKSVQIEDTWVCATQNRIGIVPHGDSSKDIDAQLSKIEDNGKKGSSRNFDYETLTSGTRELKQEQWSRIERDWSALKEEMVSVTSGKKKASSKGDQCSFWHESNDRAQKLEPNAATPSGPSMSRGRSVSKKRSIRDKSNHGSILRQPCR